MTTLIYFQSHIIFWGSITEFLQGSSQSQPYNIIQDCYSILYITPELTHKKSWALLARIGNYWLALGGIGGFTQRETPAPRKSHCRGIWA